MFKRKIHPRNISFWGFSVAWENRNLLGPSVYSPRKFLFEVIIAV